MSWMRYLTLLSFRKLNLEWDMYLYRSTSQVKQKDWQERIQQDFFKYDGCDYLEKVSDLGIEIRDWDFGEDGFERWNPVRQSDVFQWQWLAESSGVYSDMDVLFVQPMSKLVSDWRKSDVLYCLKDGHFPIGFLGSSGRSLFYKEVRDEALQTGSTNAYEGVGLHAVNRVLQRKFIDGAVKRRGRWIPESRKVDLKEDEIPEVLSGAYKNTKFCNLAQTVIYPFTHRDIHRAYSRQLGLRLPENTVAIHWYAGAKKSQEMNCRLTEQNFMQYPSLFTWAVEDLLRL